jgi:flagellar biosynthesis chaperone FliJ
MTERERRLKRLVDLRTRQHDAAIVELRVARSVLDEAELTIQQGLQQARDAHDNISQTLTHQDQHGWLLACADAEFSKLAITAGTQRLAEAAALLEAAASKETDARRERKQMEKTLELVQQDVAAMATRAEQHQLDETSRLLSGTSSKSRHSGRFH